MHHTNYSALMELAELLGCDYFAKLKVILKCMFKVCGKALNIKSVVNSQANSPNIFLD